jgi:very-short-patch-repair endonuclease
LGVTYYADFVFDHLKLIIELDGRQHHQTVEYDSRRDAYITANYGLNVIRITAKEYFNKTRVSEIETLLMLRGAGH